MESKACLKGRTLLFLCLGTFAGTFCGLVQVFNAPQDATFGDKCTASIILLESILLVPISVVGLYGMYMRKPLYLRAYVAVSILSIGFWLTVIYYVISGFGKSLVDLDKKLQSLDWRLPRNESWDISRTSIDDAFIWRTCFFMVLWLWIKSYFTRVVNHYYFVLKEQLQSLPPSYRIACCSPTK